MIIKAKKIKNFVLKTFILGSVTFFVNTSSAEELSPLAVFQRCYSRITQYRVDINSSMAKNVENGSLDPISACESVLKGGTLNSSSRLPDVNNVLNQRVLETFHRLHGSWFDVKWFKRIGVSEPFRATKVIYDSAEPSFFITRALFDPAFTYKDALTSSSVIVAQRSVDNPSTMRGLTKSDFIFNTESQFKFPDQGLLYGFQTMTSVNWKYYYETSDDSYSGTMPVRKNHGGGYFSLSVYMEQTVSDILKFRADGALKLPRKWARSLLKDVLCRELPLVRDNDVSSYVVPNSSIPFRKANTCTKCHATMDQMAYTARGFYYDERANGGTTPKYGGTFGRIYDVTKPAVSGWPSEPTPNFHLTPPNGRLFYRNYNGDLVNLAVSSMKDLSTKIASQDDPYICLAKRYYKYFIGIDVNISDPADPAQPLNMTPLDERHRSNVIQIGKRLKQHLDPQKAIIDIIKLPEFKQLDQTLNSGSSGG